MAINGDFHLTWPKAAGIFGVLVAAMNIFPLWWTISDHWMTRKEVEKELKTLVEHESYIQQLNLYALASNRVEYLEDKKFECDAKRIANRGVLKEEDKTICEHYESKFKEKFGEAASILNKAREAKSK